MYMALVAIWYLIQNFKSEKFTKKFSNWAKRHTPSKPQGFKRFRIVVQKLSRSRDRAPCFFCLGPYTILKILLYLNNEATLEMNQGTI